MTSKLTSSVFNGIVKILRGEGRRFSEENIEAARQVLVRGQPITEYCREAERPRKSVSRVIDAIKERLSERDEVIVVIEGDAYVVPRKDAERLKRGETRE